MNDENREESVRKLSERFRNISERVSDCEADLRAFVDHRANVEARLRVVESELERIVKDVSDIESRLRMIELNHNDRRERWNSITNFVVQLIWVAMAAFLLAKLGLQAPL